MANRVYCFTTTDGETVDLEFPPGMVPAKIRLKHGRVAHRDYRAERAQGIIKTETASRHGRGKAKWPMDPCVGSGVHASQGKELADFLEKRGCPTEVVDGDPIYRTPKHRKKALGLRGLHDRNSFN